MSRKSWADRFREMSHEDRVMTIAEDGSTLDALIAEVNKPFPAGEGAQETPEPEVIERTGEHPLSKVYADPQFRQEYADGLRQEAANLRRVADKLEADADKVASPALPPERAALVEQLKALADDDDTEQRHMDADAALLNYINDSEISAAFHAIKKWYA